MFKNLLKVILSVLGKRRPSTPPSTDPPPAAPQVVDLTVWSSDGQALPDASALLTLDQFPGQLFISERAGVRRRFHIPGDAVLGWGGTLRLDAQDHEPTWVRTVVMQSMDAQIQAVVKLEPLAIRGEFFTTQSGAEITLIECTDFKLYKRFLDGEDITPVLRQRRDTGFNLLRVLGMARWMWDFNPANYPTYYADLPTFLRLCERHKLYVEFTAFADTKLIMPNGADQLRHWQQVGAALQGVPNVIVELVNENEVHQNAVFDTDAFEPFPHTLCSHGSNGSDMAPVRPAWDYETFHWNDLTEWQRKTAHNAMEDGFWVTGRPALSNENTRHADRSDRTDLAYDAARGAALMSAGSCFHSVNGKNSDLWSGRELDCAAAWADGARSLRLTERWKPYFNDSSKYPDYLRAYRRGDEVVFIRR